jgi:hypothetical protein
MLYFEVLGESNSMKVEKFKKNSEILISLIMRNDLLRVEAAIAARKINQSVCFCYDLLQIWLTGI